MSTVDEILAAGWYTDKRGRGWKIVRSPLIGIWWGTPHTHDLMLVLHENKMRLLIERDQHRDERRGLRRCIDHPVPAVISWTGKISYPQFGAHWRGRAHYASTLPEAMDAARAMAVGE